MSGLVELLTARFREARAREEGMRRVHDDFRHEVMFVKEFDEEYAEIGQAGFRMPLAEFWEKYGVPSADPSVLAQIDARQAIVDEHPNVNDGDCGTCVTGRWGYPTHGGSSPQRHPCRTLRLLAVPFAAHPDYDERWRP